MMLMNDALNTHGNIFVMPNEIFLYGLSAPAIATYAYLSRMENRNPNSPGCHTCYPSYEDIGDAISRDKRSISKYVAELIDCQLITTEQTKLLIQNGRIKKNGNLRFRLLPYQVALDAYYARQMERLDSDAERMRVQHALAKLDGQAS